jgi:hypothetical protein
MTTTDKQACLPDGNRDAAWYPNGIDKDTGTANCYTCAPSNPFGPDPNTKCRFRPEGEQFEPTVAALQKKSTKLINAMTNTGPKTDFRAPPLNQAPIKASSSEITRAAGVTKGIAASCSTPSEGAAKPPSIDEIISAERAAREATAQDSLRPRFNTRYRILKEGEFGQVASNESYRSSGGKDKSLVYGLIVLIIILFVFIIILQCAKN